MTGAGRMLKKLRDRNHTFWRWYEWITALIGWTGIAVFLLTLYNAIAEAFAFAPPLYGDQSLVLWGYMAGALLWILKADRLKYAITKDPRDEPHRKWFDMKHAQQFKPGETLILREEGISREVGSGSIITKCPTCKHFHLIASTDAGKVLDCGVYGCRGELDLRDEGRLTRL